MSNFQMCMSVSTFHRKSDTELCSLIFRHVCLFLFSQKIKIRLFLYLSKRDTFRIRHCCLILLFPPMCMVCIVCIMWNMCGVCVVVVECNVCSVCIVYIWCVCGVCGVVCVVQCVWCVCVWCGVFIMSYIQYGTLS